jgi:hypothetical protein
MKFRGQRRPSRRRLRRDAHRLEAQAAILGDIQKRFGNIE